MDEFRTKGGTKAAIVGIGSNTFLTIFNIGIGIISGSYALISEGAHTLSDVATSIIAYLGFRIGQKPADEEHPLGHGRAEAIAGLIIVLFLTMVAYEIMTGAINKIVHPELITTPSYLAAVMALIGIGVNLCIMGKIPSKELIKDIEKAATKTPQVLGAHNIKVEYLGSYSVVSLHIELDENMTLKESHKIVHRAQNNVLKKVPLVKSVTIHACPAGIEYDHKQEIDK